MTTTLSPDSSVRSILVADDDVSIQRLVSAALRHEGYDVTVVADGREALARVAEATPDLIILDVMMPMLDGYDVLKQLRADAATKSIPVIMLTSLGATENVVKGLGLGADDYLPKPFQINELRARVRAKLERPPVPREYLARDLETGLLSESLFVEQTKRELERVARGGAAGVLAYLRLNEMPRLREQLGARVEAEIAKQLATVVQSDSNRLELAGRASAGQFALLLPELDVQAARKRLSALSQRIARFDFVVQHERLRLIPTIGFALLAGDSFVQVRERAHMALDYAASQLDLEPSAFSPSVEAFARKGNAEKNVAARKNRWVGVRGRLLLPFQLAVTFTMSVVVPFIIYALLDRVGFDITPGMYVVVVIALLVTAISIWIEGFCAIPEVHPPKEPGAAYPPATAIIAAYMPNEAATILETIDAFFRIDYPAPLQIILAFNTPRDLPIERTLKEIARREPRFMPLRVEGSESKAQNLNAALSEVKGEFVGVFDADHQPQPDSFTRAWRWLSNGYDVVQGHCQVRNGDASWVARLTAVEFEAIYAVSHPGRNRLHSFGIFGGSNGYWKKEILQQTRMHGFMLTEDIDSSMRITVAGYKIISDPLIVSRELAPATIKALWNQRMRWAQGWFQVSREHFWQAMRSPKLTPRQKVGIFYLLGWREIYPWLSVQMFPIIAYWVMKYGGLDRLDWLVPIFVLTTLFTLSVGPGQTILAYLLATPEIRSHKPWFLFYLLMSSLFYTEFKNIIARVAHVKEAIGERTWRITPRTQNGPSLSDTGIIIGDSIQAPR